MSNRTTLLATIATAAALTVGMAGQASANLVFTGNIPNVSGGVGNSQIVLSLSSPGSTSTETGGVTPAGCTGDTQSPCSSPANQTPTFASAGVTSAQNLAIFLDAQEPGNDNQITVNSLTLSVFAATGTSATPLAFFTLAAADVGRTLTTCPGQGNNCVNAFALDTTQANQLQTIFSSDLRVGLSSSLSNATGGPDRFFLATRTVVTPTPEPASLALFGMGLLGLGFAGRMTGRRGGPRA